MDARLNLFFKLDGRHWRRIRTNNPLEQGQANAALLVWAERHPRLAQAVIVPLICWSFSSSMFRYLLADQAVPAMCRSLAAARLSAD